MFVMFESTTLFDALYIETNWLPRNSDYEWVIVIEIAI